MCRCAQLERVEAIGGASVDAEPVFDAWVHNARALLDNMATAWGLEARVPFLDHELIELAAACPPELKLADGGKGVLKAASRSLLPAEVIDRPKGYFPVAGIRYLEGALYEIVRTTLEAPAARQRGLFRADYLQQLLAAPNEVRSNLGSNVLWRPAADGCGSRSRRLARAAFPNASRRALRRRRGGALFHVGVAYG